MSYLLSKRTVELAVPVASVFAFAANLENFPTWFPGALSIQARDTKEVDEVGKSYSEIVILPFGRKTKVNIQVMEAQKPIRLATEGNYRLLLPRMEMDFIAIDENRTKMQWRMYSRRTGISIWLLLPIFRVLVLSRSRSALLQLKAHLELVPKT